MFNTCRKYSPVLPVLILLLSLLVGQTIATAHAIEHDFQHDDEICFICDAADNFQSTINTGGLAEDTFFAPNEQVITSIPAFHSHHNYSNPARAPPESQ